MRRFFTLLLCLALLFGAVGLAEDGGQEPALVTIYATNDLHGVLGPIPDDGVIGLPMIAVRSSRLTR